MVHKTRSEQKAIGVRKDPKKLARSTRIHRVMSKEDPSANEIDEFFAEYAEPEGVDEEDE